MNTEFPISDAGIARLKQSFRGFNQPLKSRKSIPHRIRFNGEFITTDSNKTIWRTKGHAKSALLNHFHMSIGYGDKFLKDHFPQCKTLKELMLFLEKAGIIQYVEFLEQ
jgi:hypothetical protein